MITPDHINALFELAGAALAWANVYRLRRDRDVRGVYWPSWGFWASWGAWNLYYYPALGQWYSLAAGVVLVAGNTAWLIAYAALRLRRAHGNVACLLGLHRWLYSQSRYTAARCCPQCGHVQVRGQRGDWHDPYRWRRCACGLAHGYDPERDAWHVSDLPF